MRMTTNRAVNPANVARHAGERYTRGPCVAYVSGQRPTHDDPAAMRSAARRRKDVTFRPCDPARATLRSDRWGPMETQRAPLDRWLLDRAENFFSG